jgi:hypothetical protein
MKRIEIIKDKDQTGGFKVIKRQYYIETMNHLNQLIHYIDLSYTKADILYHGWVGYRTNDQMKEILTGHFRDIFDDYRCKNMLTDYTKSKGNFKYINDWYTQKLMPEFISLGLKNNANIFPAENYAQLAVKDWNNKVKGIKNMTFDSLSDALTWLALI